jgi:hypothetical protein
MVWPNAQPGPLGSDPELGGEAAELAYHFIAGLPNRSGESETKSIRHHAGAAALDDCMSVNSTATHVMQQPARGGA